MIDCHKIMREGLHAVAREILDRLPEQSPVEGDQAFYFAFETQKAQLPDWLLEKYPESMVIILQEQYSELRVLTFCFTVTLSFDGVSAQIEVPYDAITAMWEPSCEFGFRTVLGEVEKGPKAVKKLAEIMEGNVIPFPKVVN